MKVTIVIFKAYDKTCNESFVKGESMEQIHEKLNEFCNTYEPQSILKADDAEHLSLTNLDRLKQQ